MPHDTLVSEPEIQQRIHRVRQRRVMLDADLPRFSGVATRDLNNAGSHNRDRFPKDFAFYLTFEETRALLFHLGTSKPIRPTHRRRIGFGSPAP